MELTQSQRDSLRAKIDALLGENGHEPENCEMCGNDAWAIDPYILELREFGKGAIFVGGPLIPLVSLHCTKCGNSKLFNAISLGAIDQNTGNVIEGTGSLKMDALTLKGELEVATHATK